MGIFAVPPGLPLVLLLIGAAARSVLKKDGLLLLFPEIIKHGAAVDMVCFDKTVTLTDKSVSPPVAGMLCNETLGISSLLAYKLQFYLSGLQSVALAYFVLRRPCCSAVLVVGAFMFLKACHVLQYVAAEPS